MRFARRRRWRPPTSAGVGGQRRKAGSSAALGAEAGPDGDPDPTSAGTAGDAVARGGSSAAVGMAANPFGAHQAGRHRAGCEGGRFATALVFGAGIGSLKRTAANSAGTGAVECLAKGSSDNRIRPPFRLYWRQAALAPDPVVTDQPRKASLAAAHAGHAPPGGGGRRGAGRSRVKEAGMTLRPDPTERAARILAERGPKDRLDTFMMLSGQQYLWRMQGPERDRPGADFAEAVRCYEAKTGRVLARQTHPPSFGIVRYRQTRIAAARAGHRRQEAEAGAALGPNPDAAIRRAAPTVMRGP